MKAISLALTALAACLEPSALASEKASPVVSIQLLPTTDEGKPPTAITSMLVTFTTAPAT